MISERWEGLGLTISKAPLTTPHNTFENHNPPSLASGGNSANSANGFSSNVSMNSCGAAFGVVGAGEGNDRFGVIFRNVLNATCRQRLFNTSQRAFMRSRGVDAEAEDRGGWIGKDDTYLRYDLGGLCKSRTPL